MDDLLFRCSIFNTLADICCVETVSEFVNVALVKSVKAIWLSQELDQ